MKVLLVNGSPRGKKCTYTALCEVAKTLNEQGIETEFLHLGDKPVPGCRGCEACRKTRRCVIDDVVNEFLDKADTADGFVFGSPVYFAAPAGSVVSFMDRVFYGRNFPAKPACAVVSCRRGGASSALEQLNKYFLISHMPVVPSQYWNMVHGNAPEEVVRDVEGMQTMRSLGLNMAYLLKCIDAGRKAGIPAPVYEQKIRTNFIR